MYSLGLTLCTVFNQGIIQRTIAKVLQYMSIVQQLKHKLLLTPQLPKEKTQKKKTLAIHSLYPSCLLYTVISFINLLFLLPASLRLTPFNLFLALRFHFSTHRNTSGAFMPFPSHLPVGEINRPFRFDVKCVIMWWINLGRQLVQANNSPSVYTKQIELVSFDKLYDIEIEQQNLFAVK